jgi:hypothetical protein
LGKTIHRAKLNLTECTVIIFENTVMYLNPQSDLKCLSIKLSAVKKNNKHAGNPMNYSKGGVLNRQACKRHLGSV